MERHYFGLSTLLASVALLIWSIGETFAFPQGPNVSMGSNPVVSFYCHPGSTSNNSYVVPSNFEFIITDIIAGSSSATSVIYADGVSVAQIVGSQRSVSFSTGYKVQASSNIYCASSGSYISGYLAHQ